MASNVEGHAIAFPFSINSGGAVSYATEDTVIWEDRVRCVLLTNLMERVMRPDFGTRLEGLTFENETTIAVLAEKICTTAFSKWLPQLTLNSVVAVADEVAGGITVQVNYTTPQGYIETVTAKTVTLNRYGELIQGA